MSTNFEDAGYTLAELLVVICLVALFMTLVMPDYLGGKKSQGNAGVKLSQWLEHQEIMAVTSLYPEKICLLDSRIVPYLYVKKKWQQTLPEFIPPSGTALSAKCEQSEGNEESCCFMVESDGLFPKGEISLLEDGHDFVFRWSPSP